MPPTFAAPVAPGIEVASKPTTRTAPPVSKWTPKPGPDGFVLQVASFSAMGNARALKDKLSERIERVFIQKFEIDGRTLFRVRVGGFATIEQSVEPKQVLVDAGYKPLYVR
jgi:cell division septation protein DedD